VLIESEGGRLNVNYLLSGAHPEKVAFFKRYLASRGLSLQESDKLTDCLLDWINPASPMRRPNSIPESEDYRPPHRPLQHLDEIAQVAGSAPLVGQRGWKDDLTLHSTGPLDLETVPAHLLALVPGIGEQRAQKFVTQREQNEPTPGGYPFKNLVEALSYLGLNQEQIARLPISLGFRDPVTRIQSTGQSGKISRQIDVIVRKNPGAPAQILSRTEK